MNPLLALLVVTLSAETLVGTAQNGKAGAVLVTESGAVYLQSLDAWPDAVVGQSVVATGELVHQHHAPVAVQDADGSWSQGTSTDWFDTVLIETHWELAASAQARAEGAVEPGPWRISYSDGSGNATEVWSDGATVSWRYDPVTPKESSSGTYSGGAPAQGSAPVAAAGPLWVALRTLEAAPDAHTDTRTMGTSVFTVTTPAGQRQMMVVYGGAAAFESALAELRAAE